MPATVEHATGTGGVTPNQLTRIADALASIAEAYDTRSRAADSFTSLPPIQQAIALAALSEGRPPSVRATAECVGVSYTTLYRSAEFMAVWNRRQAKSKSDPTRRPRRARTVSLDAIREKAGDVL